MAETIGNRLKRLRKQSDLTQKQVAERVHISRQALGSYERDNRQMPADKLINLANLYHVSANYLLGIQEGQTIDAVGLTTNEFKLVSGLVAEMSEINEQLKK